MATHKTVKHHPTMRQYILPLARTLSIIFTPFYLPLVGMIALFTLTYLNMLPASYKLVVVALTYAFTILLPSMLIHAYRKYHGWSPFHLNNREKRMVPYIISILTYLAYYNIMRWMHMPHFMSAIIVAALFVQVFCALFNVRMKISTHTAAIGGVTGSVMAFSFILSFNALWWLIILIIIAGMVGTA
ncbi:MAG: hypothetical protein MSA38_06520, partial [Bacteroidales bacterium]|nr:hypothetical protein [Bacteroidales bacterium]